MRRLFIKAVRDLLHDKNRAIVSFLAIIIGLISFGVITFSYHVINREILNVFTAIHPASASIVVDKVDDQLISLTKEFKDIVDFEEKAFYELRVQTGADEWKTLHLFGAKDFSQMKLNKIKHVEGVFQPNINEALIERDALGVANTAMNKDITILLPDGSQQELKITGIINDISVHPASMHNNVYLYVSYDTLAALGLQGNKIDIVTVGDPYDRQSILTISNNYIKMLEQNGYKVKNLEVSNTPGVSIHLSEYTASLFILQVFSIVSFIFGCMIMSSLLSSILSNQIRQIGILKAIGAKSSKICISYLLALFILIIAAVAVSLPLSMIISGQLSVFLMRISNMQVTSTSISPSLYLLFMGLGLVVPLVVAFVPIRSGLKITVKDALNDYGIQSVKLDGILLGSKFLSRPVILSLRNSMRRRGRFLLNIGTLSFGGALFITVVAAMISMQSTLSNNLNSYKFDYSITTGNGLDDRKLSQVVESIPEVIQYESWGNSGGKVIYNDGRAGNLYPIVSPANNSEMVEPDLLEGRWLNQDDTKEIVVSHKFFISEPDFKLGDTIHLQIGKISQQFTIVGTIKDVGFSGIYMSKNGFDNLIPEEGKYNSIKLVTQPDIKSREKKKLYQQIEEKFNENEINILQSESKMDQLAILAGHTMVTLRTFFIVILMLVVVSGFGLAATMNVQTTERTKEIGIMKAIGASGKQITNIVTAESIFIGIVSWIVSIFIGIPLGIAGISVFGNIIIKTPLDSYYLSFPVSYAIWLLLTFAVGYFASGTSAKRAANLSIKQSLVSES